MCQRAVTLAAGGWAASSTPWIHTPAAGCQSSLRAQHAGLVGVPLLWREIMAVGEGVAQPGRVQSHQWA